MNPMLVRAFIGLALVLGLLAWSTVAYARTRARPLLLQASGAGCLGVVVAVHLFEARHVFGFMGWGQPHSAGHYVDLGAAILGLTLLLAGYLLRSWTARVAARTKR